MIAGHSFRGIGVEDVSSACTQPEAVTKNVGGCNVQYRTRTHVNGYGIAKGLAAADPDQVPVTGNRTLVHITGPVINKHVQAKPPPLVGQGGVDSVFVSTRLGSYAIDWFGLGRNAEELVEYAKVVDARSELPSGSIERVFQVKIDLFADLFRDIDARVIHGYGSAGLIALYQLRQRESNVSVVVE